MQAAAAVHSSRKNEAAGSSEQVLSAPQSSYRMRRLCSSDQMFELSMLYVLCPGSIWPIPLDKSNFVRSRAQSATRSSPGEADGSFLQAALLCGPFFTLSIHLRLGPPPEQHPDTADIPAPRFYAWCNFRYERQIAVLSPSLRAFEYSSRLMAMTQSKSAPGRGRRGSTQPL